MTGQIRYQCPRCGAITVTQGFLLSTGSLNCRYKGCTRSLNRRHQVE